jgi:hypothetical protein
LTELEYLGLVGTKVSDASLPILKRFTKLKTLNLVDSKLTPPGADELRDALPDCEVFGPDAE